MRGIVLLSLVGLGTALAGCATHKAPPPAAVVATPASCVDVHFPIYFEEGSATVTPEAEKLVVNAQHRASGCTVTRIDVLGLADAPGGPAANLELSQRRAAAVAEALGRHGFSTSLIQQEAVGNAGATTDSGARRPLRRRANVTIHLTPPAR